MVRLDQPDVPRASRGEGSPWCRQHSNSWLLHREGQRSEIGRWFEHAFPAHLCHCIPCVVPSASIGGGAAPKVDIAFHGVLVDCGEFLCREVQVVEGGDILLQLGDTARPDED